jgi:hypothetical protein
MSNPDQNPSFRRRELIEILKNLDRESRAYAFAGPLADETAFWRSDDTVQP